MLIFIYSKFVSFKLKLSHLRIYFFVAMFYPFLGSENVSIYDVYKIDKEFGDVQATAFGEWNELHGLTIFEKNMWKRRSNMKHHRLK